MAHITFDFEINGVSARSRANGEIGVEPVRTRGEESIFSRFCAGVYYGLPLTNNRVTIMKTFCSLFI